MKNGFTDPDSDGCICKIFSTDPVTEKYKLFEKPLKSRRIGLFKKSKTLKSDGSDGFYGRGKITDPVREDKGFLGHCDRLCGTEKPMRGYINRQEAKRRRKGIFGKS